MWINYSHILSLLHLEINTNIYFYKISTLKCILELLKFHNLFICLWSINKNQYGDLLKRTLYTFKKMLIYMNVIYVTSSLILTIVCNQNIVLLYLSKNIINNFINVIAFNPRLPNNKYFNVITYFTDMLS